MARVAAVGRATRSCGIGRVAELIVCLDTIAAVSQLAVGSADIARGGGVVVAGAIIAFFIILNDAIPTSWKEA